MKLKIVTRTEADFSDKYRIQSAPICWSLPLIMFTDLTRRFNHLFTLIRPRRWTVAICVSQRPEFEQAALRLAIVLAITVYILSRGFIEGVFDQEKIHILWLCAAFITFSSGILALTMRATDASVIRRLVGMIADNGVLSYALYRMDETGAAIVGIYLFVTFGNGFRYGKGYLHTSQALSVVGFSTVLMLSPFWSKHLMFGAGILVGLIVLPFYVGILAERIQEAKKKADEANKAKGRFLANMSHEMRTPLNGVIAMADVLRETSLNESQSEIVDTLATSAQLLLAQIEDVLDMAKIEAGRVQIEARPFDLGRLLTSTIKVVIPQARYKSLEVTTELASEATQWFVGDAHHLRQVLLNLLANAVKFTERGEVKIRAFPLSCEGVSSILRFEVVDTGIGIAAEKQAEIFEPFTQADDSITRVYGGTGLGTSIARHLVLLMGGKIGVISNVGKGSTFWFELPLAHAESQGIDLTQEFAYARAPVGAASLVNADGNVHKLRAARILVAEDNATNQRVTRMILESRGHALTIVDNGEAALNELERGGYDLALFDLSMPLVSGLEALKLYRFSCPRPIPILILSAHFTTELVAECQQAGAAEFIPKPIRASWLLDAINRHMALEPTLAQPVPLRNRDERPMLAVVDTPYVDPVVLTDLEKLSSDTSFVDRLIRGFDGDCSRLIPEICQSISQRKFDRAKDCAHALKGGAGSVGASRLMQIATRIEKASAEALHLRATHWTEELVEINRVTLEQLNAYLAARAASNSKSS